MYEETADERRLQAIERRCNQLADLIEILARERHERLQHPKPFGEFKDRDRNPFTHCDDMLCSEVFDLANVDRL